MSSGCLRACWQCLQFVFPGTCYAIRQFRAQCSTSMLTGGDTVSVCLSVCLSASFVSTAAMG